MTPLRAFFLICCAGVALLSSPSATGSCSCLPGEFLELQLDEVRVNGTPTGSPEIGGVGRALLWGLDPNGPQVALTISTSDSTAVVLEFTR